MQDWGLNPETTEVIDGSVNIRGWDANMGRDANGDTTVPAFDSIVKVTEGAKTLTEEIVASM